MKKYIIIFFTIFSVTALYGEFNPWNSDIDTGDKLYKVTGTGNYNPGIINGTQGGAFFLIRFFQVVISPQDGPNCRHIPTCSAYGKQAVIKHGGFLGALMAGERLLRCNPYYPPGIDPVPEKVSGK